MPESPRRKRFQFHLSTAIVMMFVAGGLIWANTRITIKNETTGWEAPDKPSGWLVYSYSNDQGWPLTFRQPPHTFSPNVRQNVNWFWREFAIDLTVALTLLCAVWYVSERLIRRR